MIYICISLNNYSMLQLIPLVSLFNEIYANYYYCCCCIRCVPSTDKYILSSLSEPFGIMLTFLFVIIYRIIINDI